MRVFVTGGTGLVGMHVIRALTARGDEVVALSRTEPSDRALREMGAQPRRGDLDTERVLEVGAENADAVVHAAAIIVKHGDWEEFRRTNVVPTERIATACGRVGRRLVHLSSVAVYGRATTYDRGANSVAEDFGLDRPIFPGDHYARSKREAELALWRIAESTGLRAVALRPCVIYGEGDRTFAARVARVVQRGIAPQIGDGTNPLSVVYAGNVAAAVLGALDRPAVTGAFNVCNDGAITQHDFLAHFARGLGVRLKIVRIPRGLAWQGARLADLVLRRLRPGAPMTMLKTAVQFLANPNPYTSAKAREQLGWTPVLDPPDAVERTARWYAA